MINSEIISIQRSFLTHQPSSYDQRLKQFPKCLLMTNINAQFIVINSMIMLNTSGSYCDKTEQMFAYDKHECAIHFISIVAVSDHS